MPLPNILSLALKSILVNRLQKILCCSEKIGQFLKLAGLVHSTDSVFSRDQLSLSEISVHRVQSNSRIWYASAVSFKLARSEQQLTMKLALEMADALNRDIIFTEATTPPSHLDRIWQNFTVEPVAPGWIHLSLSEIGLHEWLILMSNRLPALIQYGQPDPAVLSSSYPAPIPSTGFPVLYTHARCCTLLRLGLQEQLVPLTLPVSASTLWTLTDSEAISWLNVDRQFRCTHLTEWQLIAQIVDSLDELGCAPDALFPERLWQIAHRLSLAFQAFYAHCRLFGAIKIDDRALAQARFGLVLITQALLYWILRDWLGIAPPIVL